MADTLRKSAAAGVKWTGISSVVLAALQIIQLLILVRILTPEVFGVVAMVSVVIGFGQVFGRMGFTQAVIQRPEPKKLELASLYWVTWGISTVVFVIVAMSAPLVAWFYDIGEVRGLLVAAALVFLIQPHGSLYRALLEKHLSFRPLAIIETSAACVSLVVTVYFALADAGAWALVYGQLTNASISSIGFALAGRNYFRPKLHFDRADLNGYLSFGLYRVGAMSLNYLNSRVDQIIIGALLGPQALGYYSVAFNLVMRPAQQINPIFTRVAFPILSKVQDDTDRVKRGYFMLLRVVATVNAPILVGLAVLAYPAVYFLLGDSWLTIVPLLQLLALYAFMRTLGNAGGSLVLAKGRADFAFRWNAMLALFIPAVVFLSATYGDVIVVARNLLLMQIGLFFAWYFYIVRVLIGPCFRGYARSVLVPSISALIAAAGLVLFQSLGWSFGDPLNLSIACAVGLFSYLALYVLFSRQHERQELRVLFMRITKNGDEA